MKPQHPGLRVLTTLSSQLVSLELVGMITPRIALPRLIGSLIRVHRLGEWQARNGSQDGGLGQTVKRSPLPR